MRGSLVVSTAVVGAALAVAAPARAAANPVQAENAQPGTAAWWAREPPPSAAEAYTSEVSAAPGEALHLHVSTDGARYRVEVYRLGWYGGAGGRLIACAPGCGSDEAGHPQPPPREPQHGTGIVEAGWPVTDTIPVGDWTSGYYLADVRLTSGAYAGSAHRVPFVVRAPASGRSAILVQVPVNTWQAYNAWGGKSLYNFNSTNLEPANHVSFDRPYARGAGYQSPFVWEIQLVRFLEREGYDLSYQTDLDTHRDPQSLLRHRLAMVSGHDEYWTKEMRDGWDAARAASTNLAFMGANAAYWQVRYEDGGRTLVGYKSLERDPVADPAVKTDLFRKLSPPRYECELMGVQHQDSIRVGPQIPYTVTGAAATDPWFAGTGFRAGDELGDLVGREWDQVPAPWLPEECRKPGLVVLFHYGGWQGPADAVRYTAPSGARVFAAGSLQFSWGLDDFEVASLGHAEKPDPRLQQFMRNALADLTRPAAPTALRVHGRYRDVALDPVVSPDPRVRAVRIYRRSGAGAFAPAAADLVATCALDARCHDRPPARGVYRYAATTVDEWGESEPVLSSPVTFNPAGDARLQLRWKPISR